MTTDATALITARDFWTQELPGPMSLLMDPQTAMVEETEAAQRLAARMGVETTGDALPRFVWCILYPEVLAA